MPDYIDWQGHEVDSDVLAVVSFLDDNGLTLRKYTMAGGELDNWINGYLPMLVVNADLDKSKKHFSVRKYNISN